MLPQLKNLGSEQTKIRTIEQINMYQNAPIPPHAYSQGGYGAQPPPQGGGGYYDNNNMQQPPPQQYGAPSPVNAAYQRANAAMTRGPSPSPNNNNPGTAGGGAGGGSSGLIRLTLRKPMGIVFEPMTDPHNPSQQRGVRICDLPRTGAAAMSLKLEVGDELLSINDKTMSRLTFDEIMDFIIEADKDRVDLLFRRPGKDKMAVPPIVPTAQVPGGAGAPLSPMGLGGIGSNSNSVKWIDEGKGNNNKLTEENIDEENHRSGRGDRGRGKRDDPSVDEETYDDGGYTVESQSQYTMETYEDDAGGRRGGRGGRYDDDDKRGKRDSRRGDRRDRDRRDRRSRKTDDPVESGGFLDLLIDTLCTSVMGRDARDMCGDGSVKNKGSYQDKYDEDDEFTIDDGTYATYEDEGRRRRMDEEESLGTNEDTFVTNDDDGTRTLEEINNSKKKHHQKNKDGHGREKSNKTSKSKSKSNDQMSVDDDGMADDQFGQDPPPHHSLHYMPSAPDPPTKMASQSRDNIRMAASAPISNHLQEHNHGVVDHQMNDVESAIASGVALPVQELEYDDRWDAADVSVMESLGGPSLLVERARHENAAHTGADRASFENLDRQDPELAELINQHGEGFVPEPGMTKEETAFRDPYKFYEFAVCALLRENEPEKVRLLSKLMAKYRGRERHLINKLSARYNKDGGSDKEEEPPAAPSVAKSKSNASEASNNNMANKQSMAGMDQIQEGEEDEQGSSVLNDPSRANVAAIEAAKKQMESAKGAASDANAAAPQDEGIPSKKSSNEDGWPPAMSDPWGTGGQAETSATAHETTFTSNNNDDEDGSRPIDDDEGSYSDGSSYTESGDEIDGTSPAIIAQVSELLNYVYGKTSVAGQIDRVSTIMRAYEGREAVLLELLETKALIKANADSNGRDAADLPSSLRNSPGLNKDGTSAGGGGDGNNSNANESSKKLTPQTPISVLTAPTLAQDGPASPATVNSPKNGGLSPSAGTLNTFNSTTSKKKKKGIFKGFFGSKKKTSSDQSMTSKQSKQTMASTTGKNNKNSKKKISKKGQPLNNDDRSI